MQPPSKQWHVETRAPAEHFARLSHLHPLIVQILYNRGVVEPGDVEVFLRGEARLDDPFRIQDMSRAVDRIRHAIGHQEPITVYGDFDADGVTATVLLVQTLKALGAQVEAYIPHRVDEGYGLNKEALAELAQQGRKLIITVDCGIRAVEEVADANRLGLDVVVTDHHSIGPQLPPAVAAINPKRQDCPYPFKGLAGVGVAFKLAQALLRKHQHDPLPTDGPVMLEEGDLLDLVALGTVADLVPLLGENRVLVQKGLTRLNKPQRPGLQAMMQKAGLVPGQVTSTTIAFVLGPRLNAAGRMDSAMLSYELLQTEDVERAIELATQLEALNKLRQDLTVDALEEARAQIERDGADGYLYLAANSNWPAGIVGLVAGRLVEQYYRPALVVVEGPVQSRGSARSIAEFDITAALDHCAEQGLLVRHGGHAAAAGFTIETGKMSVFKEMLQDLAAQALAGQDLRPILPVDAAVHLGDLDWATWGLLRQLEPTGYGNPQPVLVSRRLRVRSARQVGKDGSHLKLRVSDPEAGPRQETLWDAIAFRQGHWFGYLPQNVDLVYSLDENIWNGERRLQLIVHDLQRAE